LAEIGGIRSHVDTGGRGRIEAARTHFKELRRSRRSAPKAFIH